MKSIGKVEKYNGVYGTIIDNDGHKFILLDKNIIDDDIKENETVEFESEKMVTPEVEMDIARFVKRSKEYSIKE